MTEPFKPSGREREVRLLGGVTIDGAPVAYVVVMAAVVTALSFVFYSVDIVQGRPFPLSHGVYALVGILLGPWAGGLAAGIGRLVAIFLAPHTAGAGLPSVLFSVVWAAAGGFFVRKERRNWLTAWTFLALVEVVYVGRAVMLGVGLHLALAGTAVALVGLLLWVLPTRVLARRWLGDHSMRKVTAGLFLSCLIVNAAAYNFASAWNYLFINPWPAAVWAALAVAVPLEQLFRTVVGTVIGAGVIAGLRTIGLKKPARAAY
ncbi:MAG: hypothetical protein ACUVXG_00240 [Anaerolineae bacterium]